MRQLLISKFETYLFDDEPDFELNEQYDDVHEKKFEYKEFPEGFFTSL